MKFPAAFEVSRVFQLFEHVVKQVNVFFALFDCDILRVSLHDDVETPTATCRVEKRVGPRANLLLQAAEDVVVILLKLFHYFNTMHRIVN